MGDRTDDEGAAFAGSQLQTQLYVNKRADELSAAIHAEFPELTDARIEWRSPLASDNFAEYWDTAFLKRVGLEHHVADLKAFWPTGGPHWDALAVVDAPDTSRPGILLAEGKSYPDELRGSGCQANPNSASRTLIEKSLSWTQARLGVEGKTPDDWCGSLYQGANRLAHHQWLISLGVRAWLVHLLFVGDPIEPTDAPAWSAAVAGADAELGLGGTSPAGVGHILLPAGTREELIA